MPVRVEGSLELDSLQVLLVLNFLLDILVSLKEFVVFSFSELQPLIEITLELLLESVHLVLLLLDELGLCSDDLLVPLFHVLLSFLDLHLLAPNLDLMGLSVFLLLSKGGLDLLLIEEVTAELEGQRELLLEHLSVLLEFHGVPVL